MMEAERPDYDKMGVAELGAQLKELKAKLEEASVIKAGFQSEYDFLSMNVIPDRMDEEKIKNMKIEGVGRLQTSSDIRCSVPAANREAVQEWLMEHGHGSMVSPSVNASTLKAFVKERMKEGKEWPEHLLTVMPYSRATVVKG